MAAPLHHGVGEVEPGVTLADLATTADCDGVLDRLQASLISIEQQLAGKPSADPLPDWRPRAKAALRAKKLWLPRVQARRAEIVRQAKQARQDANVEAARAVTTDKRRVLLRLAWDTEPEAMKRVEAIARERHPELFTEGEAA